MKSLNHNLSAWYVLNSKPQKEGFLYQQLKLRGLDIFYPRIKVKPVNPRSRRVRPYFPGYLFVRLDLAAFSYSKLAWIPGLQRILAFDGAPARVPDEVINQLKLKMDQLKDQQVAPHSILKPGQAVWIDDPRFKGYEAIFDTCLDGRERVRVLIKMLNGHQVPLELPEALVSWK